MLPCPFSISRSYLHSLTLDILLNLQRQLSYQIFCPSLQWLYAMQATPTASELGDGLLLWRILFCITYCYFIPIHTASKTIRIQLNNLSVIPSVFYSRKIWHLKTLCVGWKCNQLLLIVVTVTVRTLGSILPLIESTNGLFQMTEPCCFLEVCLLQHPQQFDTSMDLSLTQSSFFSAQQCYG